VNNVIHTKLSNNNLKLLLTCIICLIAFMLVLRVRDYFAIIDLNINIWVPTIHSISLTCVALGVSFIFDTYILLAITLAISAFLFLRSYQGESLLLLGSMGGDTVLVATFKSLVHSPRPSNGLVANSGFSFPSGHTTGSIVFCGLITYFVWQHWKTPKPRALLVTLSVTISSIVSFDRLYLNVHWFSDVLGGVMLGLSWLTFSILIFQILKTNRKVQTKES
jgi:undecaprenyl-diphosphatase